MFIVFAAALMALASLATSVHLSHGLQSRILQVQETTALRRQLFLLSEAMQKAEAAQRFYIITGDLAHGAPVAGVEAAMPERIASLRQAASHSREAEGLQQAIAGIGADAEKALAALRVTMDARETRGRDAAILMVESGETHAILTAIYEKLAAAMEQLEERLAEQSRDMMRAERLGHSGAIGAGVVAMLLAALGIWQWHRTLRHRQREMELAIEKSRAEQTARDKGDFLAAMSHEVRTPLNAILGLSENLRDTLPEDTPRSQAGAVHAAATGLLRVVNDLLDLSRMDAGRLQLTCEPVPLQALADSIHALLAPQAAAEGIALEISTDPAFPPAVMADAGRLRQIILNLAGNALKFTPRGGAVRLRIEQEREAAGDRLIIEVKDNGSGIPPALQQAIFAPYVQAPQPAATREIGTGLGLAIVRQLVNLMGGAIGLQSQPGAGSTFRVTLPLLTAGSAVPEANPAHAAAPPATKEIPARPQPLSPQAAETLRTILQHLLPPALATQSTRDVQSLVTALEALGVSEQDPLLQETAGELRRAAASFAVTALTNALASLPRRLGIILS